MPRNGSGVYSQPHDDVDADTTIESAVYNAFTRDVETDLNAARPIIAGGSGATSADGALQNLNAEKAAQLVVDYNTHLWMPGSFRSVGDTPGAPVANHDFCGVCILNEPVVAAPGAPTNQNLVLEARDQDDTVVPGKVYVREKKAGVWSAWVNPLAGFITSAASQMGQCRLTKSGANLLLSRCDGKYLYCDGALREIPAAGVTLAPIGGGGNSLHFIYAKMSAGVMILTRDLANPVIDATTGIYVMPTDATATLVGMARDVAGAWMDSARQRFVSSWFNRRLITTSSDLTAVRSITGGPWANTMTVAENAEFLLWGGETAHVEAHGSVINSVGNAIAYLGAMVNGTITDARIYSNIGVAWASALAVTGSFIYGPGTPNYHVCTLSGGLGSGSGSNNYQASYSGVRVLTWG